MSRYWQAPYQPSYYAPEDLKEDPHELCMAICATLQHWLDCHTNAEAWATGWLLDEDPTDTLTQCPVLDNRYFRFEWREEVYKAWVRKNQRLFVRCKKCGSISEDGYMDCCEDPQPYARPPKAEWIIDWLSDFGDDFYPKTVDNDLIFEVLVKKGFPIYRDALRHVIAGIVEEVKISIRRIRSARTNNDRLVAALAGTAVYHVHGNIMSDYGDRIGLDYGFINQLRNEGPSAVLDPDVLQAWLEEDQR